MKYYSTKKFGPITTGHRQWKDSGHCKYIHGYARYVEITFACHDLNDKSIDTAHKLVAREMMKMQRDLNKQYFAMIGDSLLKHENTLQISCWTCHRGTNEPQLVRPKKQ